MECSERHGHGLREYVPNRLDCTQRDFRHSNPMPGRTLDVEYGALVTDPTSEVAKICAFLALDYTAVEENVLRSYLATAGQYRFGVHRYSLARFGIGEQQVKRELADLV